MNSRYFGPGNKIMVFGTSAIGKNGEPYTSKLAGQRVHRAAEAYYDRSFNRASGLILMAGGYPKDLKYSPPLGREARLMKELLLEHYDIPEDAILIEDESTNTEENFEYSLERHPDFFEDIISGERELGLVSDPNHLKRVVMIGSRALGFTDDKWARRLPTWRQDGQEGERVAIRQLIIGQEAVRMAADL